MDQRENQQRALEETRERVGLLAGELASRANPPYIKARIREVAEHEAEHAKEVARKKARDVREDVKEAAMEKAEHLKGRVVGSPMTYSLLGALGGWLLGALIGRRVAPRLEARVSSDEYFGALRGAAPEVSTSDVGGVEERAEGLREKASDAMSAMKDKASSTLTSAKDKATDTFAAAKGRVGSTVSQVRERVPSAHELSDRTSGFIHTTASTRPLLFALVPLCLGALFALLLPMSPRERSALSTAKQKLNQQLGTLTERMEERIAAEPAQKGAGPINDGAMNTAPPPAEEETEGLGV